MLGGVEAQKANIKQLKTGDSIEFLTAAYDFSVISFFKGSDDESVKVDAFMEGAQKIFGTNIAEKEWTSRNVGWFRVDIETDPDMAYSDQPDQLVMSKTGLKRQIHFSPVGDADNESENMLALVVKELTGDWTIEISCEQIQSSGRHNYDEVVYFGDAADLEEGGKAWPLVEASMVDRYQYDEQRYAFRYETSKECRKERSLDEDKNYVVFYNGPNALPFVLEFEKDDISISSLQYELTIRAVNGTPKWGSRANSALFDFYKTGLIYMLPEIKSTEEMMADW